MPRVLFDAMFVWQKRQMTAVGDAKGSYIHKAQVAQCSAVEVAGACLLMKELVSYKNMFCVSLKCLVCTVKFCAKKEKEVAALCSSGLGNAHGIVAVHIVSGGKGKRTDDTNLRGLPKTVPLACRCHNIAPSVTASGVHCEICTCTERTKQMCSLDGLQGVHLRLS